MKHEYTIKARQGDVSFHAYEGGYLWVNLGRGWRIACEGGRTDAIREVPIADVYPRTEASFANMCHAWWDARVTR